MGSKRRNDNMSEKTQGEELKEKLFDCKKNGWESTSEEEGRRIFQYCDGYINFLSKSKTEREIVKNATQMAREGSGRGNRKKRKGGRLRNRWKDRNFADDSKK